MAKVVDDSKVGEGGFVLSPDTSYDFTYVIESVEDALEAVTALRETLPLSPDKGVCLGLSGPKDTHQGIYVSGSTISEIGPVVSLGCVFQLFAAAAIAVGKEPQC